MTPQAAAATVLALLLLSTGITAVEGANVPPLATMAVLLDDGEILRSDDNIDSFDDYCDVNSDRRWDESHLPLERARQEWYWNEVSWLKSEQSSGAGGRRATLWNVLHEIQSKVPQYEEKIHRWFEGQQGLVEDEIMGAIAGSSDDDGGDEEDDEGDDEEGDDDGIIYSGSTTIQRVQVGRSRLTNDAHGVYLKLDGWLQSSTADEALYHESLVHQALVAHPGLGRPVRAKRVFIGGGGEGANLREVLKYDSVEHVLMVDIDEAFVEICQKHLGTYHAGGFNDGRVEVQFGDARAYLEADASSWDVIILDFPDFLPRTDGFLLGQLYSLEFYAAVKQRLALGGILITQGGSFEIAAVHRTLRHTFAHVAMSTTLMFTYPLQTWFLASDTVDFASLTAEEVDDRLRDRIGVEAAADLKWYDGTVHERMFDLGSSLLSEDGDFDGHGCVIVDRVDLDDDDYDDDDYDFTDGDDYVDYEGEEEEDIDDDADEEDVVDVREEL